MDKPPDLSRPISDPDGPGPKKTNPPAFLQPSDNPGEIGKLGGYGIQKILGKGGMGFVFLAHDRMLDRQVALKVMLPEVATPVNRDRFFREARATAALHHDHIVPIFQVGEENGVPYLVMPYLQGEPLDRRLAREKKPPLKETLRIIRETTTGLMAAHGKGMIHRDIKPANIWLEGPRGRVRILDFGLVRTRSTDVRITQAGAIMGTPAYMSPEQAAGNDAEARADLFSVGVILYEMLTGERPFKGNDTLAILSSLLTTNPSAPSALDGTIPSELSDLAMNLIAKDPEKRPSSARDVAIFLAKVEKGTQSQAPTISPTPEPSPFVSIPPGNAQPFRSPAPAPLFPTPPSQPQGERIFDTKMILNAIPAHLLPENNPEFGQGAAKIDSAPSVPSPSNGKSPSIQVDIPSETVEDESPRKTETNSTKNTMASASRLICPGCGQNVDPSQNGGKPKMRCPGCGVMLDLRDMPGYDPTAFRSSGKSAKSGSETTIDEDSPFESNPFKAEGKKKPKGDSAKKIKTDSSASTPSGVPTEGSLETPPLPFAPPSPHFETSLEDDGLAYAMPGGFDFNCPACSMLLKPGTALCVRCGFDFQTGKKKRTTVKPISLWIGPQFSGKMRASICIFMPSTIMAGLYFMGILSNGVVALQIVGWILLTFILGTWHELTVERTSKGKTTITRNIRVAFVPVPGGIFDADQYDGVSTRIEEQITFVDYIVMINLFGMGILPGVIFYFAVMQRPEHAIFLTGEHGASLQDIFRSRDHKRIFEILEEISRISGLPKRL